MPTGTSRSAESATATATETLLAGRFRIWRTLQATPRAELLLAEDEQLGRRVTVKRVPPGGPGEALESLRREAELGRGLDHPGLVAVHELVTGADGAMLVMDYLEGELLSDVLGNRRLPVDGGLHVIQSVGAALEQMHAGGAVHGDVATAHVLLGFGDAVKLIDLGFAMAPGEDTGPAPTSGPIPYLAPERFDSRAASPGIDVYGLAAVAYEVFARERARPGLVALVRETKERGGALDLDAARRAAMQPAPDLRDAWKLAPASTAELLRRGMSPDPSERSGSMAEFTRELSASLEPVLGIDGQVDPDGGDRPHARAAAETKPAMLAGRYRVLRSLGSGAFGTVYLAEDQQGGDRVAIKRLRPDSPQYGIRRLEREAEIGLELDHPNLVAVRELAADDDGPLLVLGYLEGERLAALLDDGPLPVRRIVEVIRSVAAALDYMHSNGVLHGDVSLKNIVLEADGVGVKLIDLGLVATAAEGFNPPREPGESVGTPGHTAPERFYEEATVGPEADVYSLAIVAFEALTLRTARPRLTGNERLAGDRQKIRPRPEYLVEPPPDLREAWPAAPPAAAELVSRAMAHDPARRPGSAGAFASELADALRSPAG
jgi:serine/threonine protein kinase